MAGWRNCSVVVVLALWLCLLSPVYVSAQAFRFQPQGARAAGQGNAFAAEADDASAIHYNPAGLSHVPGVQSVIGSTVLGGFSEFKGLNGSATQGDFNSSINWPPPSNFYVSANLGSIGSPALSAVTVGVGLLSPFGLNAHYPTDGPFKTVVTSAALPLIDIKPTIAYAISKDLSIGVSADIYTFASFLGEGHAEQKQISAGTFGLPPGASLEFNGKGTGAGATASILYSPLKNANDLPILSLGLVYRSRAVVPLNGGLLVNGTKVAEASTDLVLPHMVTGAVAVWPVRTREREWKVELDVEYVGWSANRDLDIRLSNGGRIPQPQQWKDVPVIAVGTEYKWLNPVWLPQWEVAVRSGYTHTQSPIPDRTFRPPTISLAAHTLSFGVGLLCRDSGRFLGLIPCSGESVLWPKGIGLDVAYQEWFYESRTIVDSPNPVLKGTYDAVIHLGAFSFRFLF